MEMTVFPCVISSGYMYIFKDKDKTVNMFVTASSTFTSSKDWLDLATLTLTSKSVRSK